MYTHCRSTTNCYLHSESHNDVVMTCIYIAQTLYIACCKQHTVLDCIIIMSSHLSVHFILLAVSTVFPIPIVLTAANVVLSTWQIVFLINGTVIEFCHHHAHVHANCQSCVDSSILPNSIPHPVIIYLCTQ